MDAAAFLSSFQMGKIVSQPKYFSKGKKKKEFSEENFACKPKFFSFKNISDASWKQQSALGPAESPVQAQGFPIESPFVKRLGTPCSKEKQEYQEPHSTGKYKMYQRMLVLREQDR